MAVPPASGDEEDAAFAAVSTLAAIPDRGSATRGERAAADWIVGELRAIGVDARIELETAHGTHWWPYGLPPAAAAAAAALHLHAGGRLSRALAVLVGALGAAAVVEDGEGTRRLLRRALPRRRTANVVAEIGDPDGGHTVVVHAHHDAAHGGLMFHPAITRVDAPLPTIANVVAGPLLVAGAALTNRRAPLRVGAGFAAVTAALFADSGSRRPVPGANDDASGVAALLGLARRLLADPPSGVRVVLLSTGAEESMLEGMSGFARRHFDSLPTESTSFVSVDSLGWETLAMRRGEGVFRERHASAELIDLLGVCARELGVELRAGLRSWIPTDGFVALRAGYREVNLCSVQADGTFPGYHTNDDTAERVHVATITRGVAVLDAAIRRLAEAQRPPGGLS